MKTRLVSPLSETEACIRTWGGDGVSGWYQTPSCLVTEGEALGLLRIPALWKRQPEAAPDEVPGPSFSLLLPTETVSGGNGRFVALWGQLQHCVSTILQLQRQKSAGADYKVPNTWIWGTPPYKSAWGLSGVWHGGKSILWPAACNVQLVHMMKCGIALALPSSPLPGNKCSDCDTKTRSVICTCRNVISLQVKWWELCGDSLASRRPLTWESPRCRCERFLAWPWQGLLCDVEL